MALYTRKENESELELLWRIVADKEKNNWTWDQVCYEMNELTGKSKTESSWRKKWSAMNKVINKENVSEKNFNEMKETQRSESPILVEDKNDLKNIQFELRRLEKQRKKFQTEKVEYNKWLREEARDEMIKEEIVKAIDKLAPLSIPDVITTNHSTKGYALLWGDEHFGIEFELKDIYNRVINAYSPEIFEKRMWELFGYIKEIVLEKEIKTLHCFSFGDFCDGILRTSQLMKLKYGVVEATVKYADFISNWLNELSKFVVVNYQMTNGNHSELQMIGQPKGTFTEDNMGEIVAEFIKIRLKNNPNFKFIQNPTGSIFAQIACHNVLGIHGEVKNMEKALHEYSAIYNVPIDILIGGHLHHKKEETIGIRTEVINIPSIIGTDVYSLTLRKTSAPAAKIIEIDQLRGITCEYTLGLLN